MALIKRDSGCKVGWETYDNEEEAKARAAQILAPGGPRDRAVEAGYDFGYQSPGSVERRMESKYVDGVYDATLPTVYLDEWTVTIP